MRRYYLSDTCKLYHVSNVRYRDGKVFKPRIPKENLLFWGNEEDSKTPRICFSTCIGGCLLGGGYDDRYFSTLYVYEPCYDDIGNKLYKPNTEEVPDVKYTREKWVLCPVRMKISKKIKVLSRRGSVIKYKVLKEYND